MRCVLDFVPSCTALQLLSLQAQLVLRNMADVVLRNMACTSSVRARWLPLSHRGGGHEIDGVCHGLCTPCDTSHHSPGHMCSHRYTTRNPPTMWHHCGITTKPPATIWDKPCALAGGVRMATVMACQRSHGIDCRNDLKLVASRGLSQIHSMLGSLMWHHGLWKATN